MARLTVEDCVQLVPNRFDLVLLAARRARGLSKGALPEVPRDDDKIGVIALREIAGNAVPLDVLRDQLLDGLRRQRPVDEPAEPEVQEMMADAQGLLGPMPVAVGTSTDALGPRRASDPHPGEEDDPSDEDDEDLDDDGVEDGAEEDPEALDVLTRIDGTPGDAADDPGDRARDDDDPVRERHR